MTDLKEYHFEQRPFVRKETCFFLDERALLETLIFSEVSYGSYQPFNFLEINRAENKLTKTSFEEIYAQDLLLCQQEGHTSKQRDCCEP